MKQKLITLIIITLLFSCNYKERNLKSNFIGKVWVVDSIKSKMVLKSNKGKGRIGTWNNILKPINDSIFDIYKDQNIIFQSYKISNDTLFLKRNGNLSPYSLKKVDDYTYILSALDKKQDYIEIYITDLTNLFNGDLKNESELFSKVKNNTWFPIEAYKNGSQVLNKPRPEYYVKDDALEFNDDKLKHSSFIPKDYKVKFTNKGMYIFNPKNKELVDVYNVSMKGNELKLVESNGAFGFIKFKKIDKTLLINKEDIPKNVRLTCSELLARNMLETEVKNNDNSSSYYDLKSIKLIDEDDVNCIYTYLIKNRNREYYDIYLSHKISVSFDDEGYMNLKEIK